MLDTQLGSHHQHSWARIRGMPAMCPQSTGVDRTLKPGVADSGFEEIRNWIQGVEKRIQILGIPAMCPQSTGVGRPLKPGVAGPDPGLTL